MTRLIQRYQKSGKIQVTVYRRHRFAQRYTAADVELLARVDEAHETLSGPATRRILEREYQQYGKRSFNVWQISLSPISTICGSGLSTANSVSTTAKPDPRR